ncbi:MAG: High-affnity carbon uptake protein Hat/HatR [Sphingobacteriales bacterium]|nr:High-affnity carbon uptake protein Hat/HatR [Sphingobacteriales bacterium]
MTREECQDAITGPVAVGGASISPSLLNQLLNDADDNPSQLPILQHALMRTCDFWKKKNVNLKKRGEIDLITL